jgi:hypothetical protein
VEYHQREYPLFSACGLNCGLCPRHQMAGTSKCPGCSGEGFLTKHPTCGLLSCTQRRGIEYCYQCNEFPCKKYDGADKADSFITHLNQFRDMEKARGGGIDAYIYELNEKVRMLEQLLADYDDGRRKSLFCLAVNLLETEDIRRVLEQLRSDTDMPRKEKAAFAASLLQAAAEQRNITLKLRKRSK